MAETLQALREKHAALAQKTRSLVEDNSADWKPENQEKYDAFMKELDDIKSHIDRTMAVLDKISDDAEQYRIDENIRRNITDSRDSAALNIFKKWARNGDKSMTPDDWGIIRNTMSVGTPAQGGYTVPTEVISAVADVLKEFGGMRDVASIIKTDSGAPINYPISDGTSEIGEIVAENTTATSLDPSFGVVSLVPYKFSSKVIAIPFELLQDSAIDMVSFITKRIGDRLARIQNQMFTTGTGTSQPLGIVTASASGKVGATGQTTTVVYDDLVDLIHSVDPAYRGGVGVHFMMNDSSLRGLRKLKDSQGRPIFLPGYDGLAGAMPDSLLGYQITINQDMAAMAANAKSILFGDFQRYTIRDVMGLTLFRFEDSAYAKLGQVGFLAWMRSGGTLTDGGAPVKYYQNSAT